MVNIHDYFFKLFLVEIIMEARILLIPIISEFRDLN